jgi:UDP-N-acetylmuramyl pentapeptide phosphotransferase/UDP-N-acetylglucosamine-1-phosphate transferase
MHLSTQLILYFIVSVILSPILLSLVAYFLKKQNLLDRPHLYKSEHGRSPAPYGAGVMILLILLIIAPVIFFFGNFSPLLEKRLLIVLIIGICISIVSFIDDMDTIGKSRIKIPPLARLIMQILVGAIIGLTSIKISYVTHIF